MTLLTPKPEVRPHPDQPPTRWLSILFHPISTLKARKAQRDADAVINAAHLLSQRAQAIRDARVTMARKATEAGLLASLSPEQRERCEAKLEAVLKARGGA